MRDAYVGIALLMDCISKNTVIGNALFSFRELLLQDSSGKKLDKFI